MTASPTSFSAVDSANSPSLDVRRGLRSPLLARVIEVSLAYRILCGVLGAGLLLGGVAFLLGFLGALGPGGTMSGPISPMGPNGLYFVAFTACGLIGWAGGLVGAARHPETGRSVGTFSAWAMVVMGLYRFAGWFMGDFAHLGELPRIEAVIFLSLAIAFVWLRPAKAVAGGAT